MSNILQDRIENNLVTRTFNVSGMPEAVFKEIDEYCKEFYGDSRWTMIADLHRNAKEDYKYSLLYDELDALKAKVALLEQKPEVRQEPDGVKRYVTFGQKVSIDDLDSTDDSKVIRNER